MSKFFNFCCIISSFIVELTNFQLFNTWQAVKTMPSKIDTELSEHHFHESVVIQPYTLLEVSWRKLIDKLKEKEEKQWQEDWDNFMSEPLYDFPIIPDKKNWK